MKKLYRILLLVFLMTIYVSASYSQPGGPGGGPSNGTDEPVGGNAGVPLDGGAIELLIAGLCYLGYRKVKGMFTAKK